MPDDKAFADFEAKLRGLMERRLKVEFATGHAVGCAGVTLTMLWKSGLYDEGSWGRLALATAETILFCEGMAPDA